MKQRLLLALLVLFAAVGMVKAADEVTVTPTGATEVTINFTGGTISVDPSVSGVTVKDKKVTIDKSVTTAVSISCSGSTNVTFSGQITNLAIDNATISGVTFSNARVATLSVTSPVLKSLTCNELGLTSLTLTGTTALEVLNASDNNLSAVSLPTSLKNLNISKNAFTTFDPTALTGLTDLNVSENLLENINVSGSTLTALANLNLSGNKIKDFESGKSPRKECRVTWGVQTLSSSLSKASNIGINMKELIKGVLGTEPTTYSSVKWMIKDGDEYIADPSTAHVQSPTYPDEYRFYNNTSKVFVRGTYQCTVTVNGRTYNIDNIEVTAAEFTLSWATPENATAFTVTKQGSSSPLTSPVKVFQEDVLLFSTTFKDGYDKVVYSIEGLKPAQGLTEPYVYNPFQCTVEGKYINVATSEVPKVSAVVSGATHIVKYETPDPSKGGTFTVEKELANGAKTAVKSGDEIATGDKLLVTILPESSYSGTLYINNTKKDLVTNNIYSYTVLEDDIDFNIAVTFVKDQIKIQAKVDGVDLASSVTYIKDGQMLVDGAVADGGIKVPASTGDAVISKNTDHQATFIIDQSVSGSENRVLDIVTINGGELKSVTSSTKEVTDASDPTKKYKEITYTVSFSVKENDIIVSIKTKKVNKVKINLVKNAKTASASPNDKQEQTYTGQSLPLLFTTEPIGLESQVVVTYKNDAGADLGTTAPIAVGTYKATLTFKETSDNVLDVPTPNDLEDFEYSILPASLSIQTLPKVTVNKAGKYEVSGGKVMFGKTEITGTFKPQTAAGSDTDAPESVNVGKSHNVTVKFTPKSDADQINFKSATANVLVEIAGSTVNKEKVSIYSPLPKDVTLQLYNGDKLIDPSTESFIKGTKLIGVVTYPVGMRNVNLIPTSLNTGTNITKDNNASTEGRDVYNIVLGTTTQFNVTADAAYSYSAKLQKKTFEYDGEVHSYKESDIQIVGKDGIITSGKPALIITYKNKSGSVVPQPIQAGEYTVCIEIEADQSKGYSKYNEEFAGMLVINKTRAIIYEWPVASLIAKGMPLSQSALSGGAANIPGTFGWQDETIVPPLEGGKYKAVFTPSQEYINNYEAVVTPAGTSETGGVTEIDKRIEVKVSDLQIVTFAPKNGKLTVVNQHGTSLESGNAVSKGDVLTITATPDPDFELKSLQVNGASYTTNYTVGESSVAIVAEFQVKNTFDPNTQYTVTLPKADAVKGVIINKSGVNAVKKDGSFSFTLGSLAADAKNIVVKVDGTTLAPVDGTYTIAKVDGNKVVTVTLSNPTKIKVSVEKETKNAKGYVVGKVEVEGLAKDSTCYYGDEVTLVAFPESGVTFTGWSGAITGSDKLATFTVKQSMTIKPKFTGVPTGIETIQDTRIYGREGHIFIGCDGEAKVTLISMDGRVKKVEISGDTRIEMAAGIYGVVVEKGSDRMQTKVIVR